MFKKFKVNVCDVVEADFEMPDWQKNGNLKKGDTVILSFFYDIDKKSYIKPYGEMYHTFTFINNKVVSIEIDDGILMTVPENYFNGMEEKFKEYIIRKNPERINHWLYEKCEKKGFFKK